MKWHAHTHTHGLWLGKAEIKQFGQRLEQVMPDKQTKDGYISNEKKFWERIVFRLEIKITKVFVLESMSVILIEFQSRENWSSFVVVHT